MVGLSLASLMSVCRAGTSAGITNTGATVTGIWGVSFSAQLLDSPTTGGWGYSWAAVFNLWAGAYFVAAMVFLAFGKVDKLFD